MYDVFNLCEMAHENKLFTFKYKMLKEIRKHCEIPFNTRNSNSDLLQKITEMVAESCWANEKECHCEYETLSLSHEWSRSTQLKPVCIARSNHVHTKPDICETVYFYTNRPFAFTKPVNPYLFATVLHVGLRHRPHEGCKIAPSRVNGTLGCVSLLKSMIRSKMRIIRIFR